MHEQAQALGIKIVTELKQGKAAEALAQQYQLQWQNHQHVSRDSHTLPETIVKQLFAMPKPQHQSSVMGLSEEADYQILLLTKVIEPQVDAEDSLNYQTHETEIERNIGVLDYQSYVSALKQKADIESKVEDKA